ncbi:ABC transporter ATP-binding protein [Microlunatus elymi]|uniref:ABC transporter ATP-binding protein n=1 Tax=Microlunatus elymi TaxID=2596828 RepID=A0A516PWL0_9ACTN|nr:ABC transporter ATP-binding protein [Microlunatus elymi]QDP95565.1 ABC transporter ATP-binding protein [Microlunatus elymi]
MTGQLTDDDVWGSYESRASAGSNRLLNATNLTAAYGGFGRDVVALDDVSVHIDEGEILGIAGESGCGKTTLGSVLSLNARPPLYVRAGAIEIDGKVQQIGQGHKVPRTWRGSVVSLLPQGAMNSISPTMKVSSLVIDVMKAHGRVARNDALDRARDRIESLGLPPRVLDAYPHQLSGGMRQRVITIISTLLNPRLLIADEPTSALDVSSQKQLIEMLKQMLDAKIMSGVIFITHDLPVLHEVADRIAVMYAGRIAEIAPADDIVENPRHPYSASLLNAVLTPDPQIRTRRVFGIPGAPPNLANPPTGCRFHPRCALAMEECSAEDPPHVGNDLVYADCFWTAKNPDVPMPMDKLSAHTNIDTEELIATEAVGADAAAGDLVELGDLSKLAPSSGGNQDRDGDRE